MDAARPENVSERAKERQRREMGTLGSGNHYPEVQAVAEIFDPAVAQPSKLSSALRCGSAEAERITEELTQSFSSN